MIEIPMQLFVARHGSLRDYEGPALRDASEEAAKAMSDTLARHAEKAPASRVARIRRARKSFQRLEKVFAPFALFGRFPSA